MTTLDDANIASPNRIARRFITDHLLSWLRSQYDRRATVVTQARTFAKMFRWLQRALVPAAADLPMVTPEAWARVEARLPFLDYVDPEDRPALA
jgi:hypothetical protein